MLASDLIALTDSQLDRYLEEHRFEGGDGTSVVKVEVDDPENLPASFIQRLQQHANDTQRSRPVDLDLVTARLLDLPSGDSSTSPQTARRPSASSSDSSSSLGTTLPPTPTEVSEERDYHELVADGGRPVYPIHLLGRVLEDPLPYWDRLWPWTNCPPDFQPGPDNRSCASAIFHEQLQDWKHFRRWQALARGMAPPVEKPTAIEVQFRQKMAKRRARSGTKSPVRVPIELPVDLAYRAFVRDFRPASTTYSDSVKALIHNFSPTQLVQLRDDPVQLHDDPAQQDRRTTWIEYLGYQCALLHRKDLAVEQRWPEFNAAWDTLLDSKVLPPKETRTSVCDAQYIYTIKLEQDQAKAAVTAAREAGAAVLQWQENDLAKPIGSRHPAEVRKAKMQAAKNSLDAAKARLLSANRWMDSVVAFKRAAWGYLNAQENAWGLGIRAQWVLKQLPLVVVDAEQAGRDKGGESTATARDRGAPFDLIAVDDPRQERRKRRRLSDAPALKRPRGHDQSAASSDAEASEDDGPRMVEATESRITKSSILRRAERLIAARSRNAGEPRQPVDEPVINRDTRHGDVS